ncbi:beta-ketoacyl synthase N-terminal-like domain-containing protein [Streptomyces sp. NPDC005877]|uniref:beta-ketoacyl-[acyl-carrier-protein] synthase family protein n=1 Tax=Streptomyces sp. NPDC005877 TaxID=3155346 RepID=UPI0033FFACB2
MSEESVMGGQCRLLTTGELMPGDVVATGVDSWHVVLRTAPASEARTRLVLRPLGGGPDHERLLDRRERQVVRVSRVDPADAGRPESTGTGRRRVVVTGLGALTPLGPDVPGLWQGLLSGRSAVGLLDGEEFAALPVRLAARAAVDPAELLPRPQARRMNRSAQLAVLAAREAWRDAGLDPEGARPSGLLPTRAGVSMGSILGGAPVLVDAQRRLEERGPRAVSPHTAPMLVPSSAAAQISIDLGILGEASTLVSACASGTEAIGRAVDRIRDGHADLVVAGGTEAVIIPAVLAAFAAMRAVSTRNDEPASACRPFSSRPSPRTRSATSR